ncbi:hypothetical protein BBJ28_00021736, partial [Nothophytophthora sp. Chile5]
MLRWELDSYLKATHAQQGNASSFGLMGSAGISAGAFLIPPGATLPEIQLTLFPRKSEPHMSNSSKLNHDTKVLVTIALLTPRARNRVVLVRDDDDAADDSNADDHLIPRVVSEVPEAKPEHLRESDVWKMTWAIGVVREIAAVLDLDEWVLNSVFRNSHWVGSASMGDTEDAAVVDNHLRVFGIKNLRIADASVIPLIPNGNVHSSVVMVASHAAELLREDEAEEWRRHLGIHGRVVDKQPIQDLQPLRTAHRDIQEAGFECVLAQIQVLLEPLEHVQSIEADGATHNAKELGFTVGLRMYRHMVQQRREHLHLVANNRELRQQPARRRVAPLDAWPMPLGTGEARDNKREAVHEGRHVPEQQPVDIEVEDLLLPPLEKAVDAGIYQALHRWNEGDPAQAETTLPYTERMKKYQRIASLALCADRDPSDSEGEGEDEAEADAEAEEADAVVEEGGDVATIAKTRAAAAARRRQLKAHKKQRRQREAERARHRAVFDELPDIDALRAERQPSARLQEFVATFHPKKRRLAQKRSVADTVTAMSFEFARPMPGPEDSMSGRPSESVRSPADRNRVEDTDPILWFDVLHPSKDPARTQSFLVRRSQRLSELVDLIACAYDERLREHDKRSKLLYFSHKFFVDRRSSGSVDYSEQIRAWIQAKPERQAKYGAVGAGDRATRSLHSATFRDLELHVDEPGVYVHQGECEHLIRLRDARLPHELDALSRDGVFPLRLPNPLPRILRHCFICQHYSAKFVCYGDRLATMDPMFFCDRCYR